MNTITRWDYISRHCDALETVARWMWGNAHYAPGVACRLAARGDRR